MKKTITLFTLSWMACVYSQSTIDWQKSFGGSLTDFAYSIQNTSDGGYIVGGTSYSNDGDVTNNSGLGDYWVVKISSTGIIEWQKSFGGTNDDIILSIKQTLDGGYIVVGETASNDGDVTDNNGGIDYWVVKLSSIGILEWQKSLGGSGYDSGRSIYPTVEGGYIVLGTSRSNDGDVTGNHGNRDYWVVKLSETGIIEWQKSLGGSDHDFARSIYPTVEGGYIVLGTTLSNDGDITFNHGIRDYWVVKLSETGIIEWQKSLGGSDYDLAHSIQQTTDEGFIVGGYSWSNDGDVSGNHGESDYWIVKISPDGDLEWQKSLGGSEDDHAYSIQQTTDEGYIIAGSSESINGDVSGNHGERDFWIVKLSPVLGVLDNGISSDIFIYPNPIQDFLNLESQQPLETVKIYNLQGQLIKEDTNRSVDVSQLTTGLYFIQLSVEGKTVTKKFIKE